LCLTVSYNFNLYDVDLLLKMEPTIENHLNGSVRLVHIRHKSNIPHHKLDTNVFLNLSDDRTNSICKGHGLLLLFYIIVRNEMACSV
jgi:hypothetical protein